MQIESLTVSICQTNCYIVYQPQLDECLVIDPGDDAQRIFDRTRQLQKRIRAILLTHGHFDHVGAVRELAALAGCDVYMSQQECTLPENYTAGPLYYTHTYTPGSELTLAGITLQVLPTPGHTPGSVCLHSGEVLFSGDTLFEGTCGRTDLPGGDFPTILRSLYALYALDGDMTVYPGHGCATTLSHERAHNLYMQRSTHGAEAGRS